MALSIDLLHDDDSVQEGMKQHFTASRKYDKIITIRD